MNNTVRLSVAAMHVPFKPSFGIIYVGTTGRYYYVAVHYCTMYTCSETILLFAITYL